MNEFGLSLFPMSDLKFENTKNDVLHMEGIIKM